MPSKIHILKTYGANIVSLLLPIIALTSLLAGMNMAFASTQTSLERTPGEIAMAVPVTVTETIKLTAFDAALGDNYGSGTALSGDTLAVGAYLDDDNAVSDSGSVYIYERHQGGSNNWGFVKKLYANDPAVLASFGREVIFDGDRLIVSAPAAIGATSETGAVYIFERNQGGPDNWGQVAKVIAADGQNEDRFGWHMDVRGDTLVVGARWDDTGAGINAGSAYIFERNQGGADNWGFVKKLMAFDAAPDDWYGVSVAVDNDIIVVGAREDDDNGTDSGSAYVYERNLGGLDNWGLVKKITASNGSPGDWFATAVKLAGDTLAIGATIGGTNNSGAVYIFERNEGGIDNWGEVTTFAPTDGLYDDRFSANLVLQGDRLLVGARWGYGVVPDSGAAYLYERNAGGLNNWGEVSKFIASDGQTDDQFGGPGGGSLGMSDRVIAIGANLHDGGTTDEGAVYLYYDPSLNVILNKSVVPSLAEPGVNITYTVQFSNVSGFVITGTILTDIIPISITNISYVNSGIAITSTGNISYAWQIADIPPGAGGTITVTGILSPDLSSEGLITNTAVFSATSPDLVPISNTAVLEVNIPPELEVESFYDINEGESITLTGTITDPGLLDSFTLVIDWGDGLSETVNYPSGTTSFQQPHLYLDDDPSGTAVDDYNIQMTLADSDGGVAEKQAIATVRNISPTVNIGPDLQIMPGDVITFTGTFTDPGSLDTFSYELNLGNGTTVVDTLALTYIYSALGTYDVTLTVTDDDGGMGQDTLQVQVGTPPLFIPFIIKNE